MSYRLYLTNSTPDVTPPLGNSGNWDQTTSAITKQLSTTKAGTSTTVALTETSTTTNWDRLLGTWVCTPFTQNGTFSGSMTITVSGKESSTSANDFPEVVVYIADNAGSSVIGTACHVIGAAEWTATQTGVSLTTATMTSVSVSVGQRIVVEYGYQAQNTVSTTFTGTISYGGTGATDLAAGSTTTTNPPWVDFDTAIGNLFLPATNAPADQVSVTGTGYDAVGLPGQNVPAGQAAVSATVFDATTSIVNNIEGAQVIAYDATVTTGVVTVMPRRPLFVNQAVKGAAFF